MQTIETVTPLNTPIAAPQKFLVQIRVVLLKFLCLIDSGSIDPTICLHLFHRNIKFKVSIPVIFKALHAFLAQETRPVALWSVRSKYLLVFLLMYYGLLTAIAFRATCQSVYREK